LEYSLQADERDFLPGTLIFACVFCFVVSPTWAQSRWSTAFRLMSLEKIPLRPRSGTRSME
jgi:hypothetical protein